MNRHEEGIEGFQVCHKLLVNTPGFFMEIHRTRVYAQILAKYSKPLVK